MVIYKITNTVNGKVYIGQTIQSNAKARWYAHCAYVRKGKKSHLYDSMRKYGVENFTWEVIEQGNTVEQLNELEAKWVDYYRSITEVYNNREAGNNKLHSTKSIQRMREAQKAAHARRRELNNGIEKHTVSHCHKGQTGLWKRTDGGVMLGKKMSEKSRKKISEARLKNNGARGKTWKAIDGNRVYMEKQ